MESSYRFEVWAGCIFTALIIGLIGNILTLVSLLLASMRKNHGFDWKRWINQAAFVCNLALVDLMACLLMLAMLLYAFDAYLSGLRGKETNDLKDTDGQNSTTCKFFILGIQNLANMSGWSIALIAVFRAFDRYRYRMHILSKN